MDNRSSKVMEIVGSLVERLPQDDDVVISQRVTVRSAGDVYGDTITITPRSRRGYAGGERPTESRRLASSR